MQKQRLLSRTGYSRFVRILLPITGLGLCTYPLASNFITERTNQDIICSYQDMANDFDEAEFEEMLKEAKEYNISRKKPYEEMLNLTEDGIMAVLEIPKIDLELPIYHGTEEKTLEKGVGHIYGSDLPVGDESSHSLLAGHRGLPNAQLFTRLNELEVGDMFVINLCGLKHTYEVCEISIIRPEDTEVLGVQEGRELISLITCTPYGINTHRLVVTGERKEDA